MENAKQHCALNHQKMQDKTVDQHKVLYTLQEGVFRFTEALPLLMGSWNSASTY